MFVPIGYATLFGFLLQTVLMTGVTIPSYAQMAALTAGTTPAGLPIGTFFYLTNHLGSSTIILDDQANVVETDAYKPFGELWDDGSGAVKDHRFYFTGKEKEEFDLYQFGARWYSPDIGRFISADSIVPDAKDSQQLNRYSYVNNNPINLVDPTGHSSWNFQTVLSVIATILSFTPLAPVGIAINIALAAYGFYVAVKAGDTTAAAMSAIGALAGYGIGGMAGEAAHGVSGFTAARDLVMIRAAEVAGGMVVAGMTAIPTGNVGTAIATAFAGAMLNMAVDTISNAFHTNTVLQDPKGKKHLQKTAPKAPDDGVSSIDNNGVLTASDTKQSFTPGKESELNTFIGGPKDKTAKTLMLQQAAFRNEQLAFELDSGKRVVLPDPYEPGSHPSRASQMSDYSRLVNVKHPELGSICTYSACAGQHINAIIHTHTYSLRLSGNVKDEYVVGDISIADYQHTPVVALSQWGASWYIPGQSPKYLLTNRFSGY